MLPKHVEKHLVTNRAAIPFIYLGACATPSNTRIIQRERERRQQRRDQQGQAPTRKNRKRKKENKDVKSSYDASGDGWCRIRERKPPQEMVIRGPSTISSTGTVRGVILGDGAAGMTLLLAEVLNSGLKLLAHDHKLLHKTQAPVPQLHSVVVPVSVPLVSQ